ncbi:MAG: hypothetical protein Fur0043_18440 [Anaerolineales bacterium]
MERITLERIIQTLEDDWAHYVPRFRQLTLQEQAAFLQKQGFESLHDLLAHIIGWWEEGIKVITGMLERPDYTWEERDTDAFNQELVAKYRRWREEDLLLHYENVRTAMLDLVADLPENALDHYDIYDWLAADVVGHLEDHKIG